MAASDNPHALDEAQDDTELFDVLAPPPGKIVFGDGGGDCFDMKRDKPELLRDPSTKKPLPPKPRNEVHRDGDWHASVHVWLVDSNAEMILLQRRSPNKDTFPNRWDISAAGHRTSRRTENDEIADDSRDTALRELAEELGVSDVSQQDLKFAFTCPAQQAGMGGCNAYEDVYFLEYDSEKCSSFSVGLAEVTDTKWISYANLRSVWDEDDNEYVPRVPHYREAFWQVLGAC